MYMRTKFSCEYLDMFSLYATAHNRPWLNSLYTWQLTQFGHIAAKYPE